MYNRSMTKIKDNSAKLDYVSLKTSARQKRLDRLHWIDKKMDTLKAERSKLTKDVSRDTVTIDALKVKIARRYELENSIPSLEERVMATTGEDARQAMKNLRSAQDEVLLLEDEIRAMYYAG